MLAHCVTRLGGDVLRVEAGSARSRVATGKVEIMKVSFVGMGRVFLVCLVHAGVTGCGVQQAEPSESVGPGDATANTRSQVDPSCSDPCSLTCPSVINVKTEFNAAGDGVTDDYAALQLAASYASTHAGATLVFPAGTYRIDRYISGSGSGQPTHITYHDVDGIQLVGCGATISVKGDFDRSSAGVNAVVPFYFQNVSNFQVRGFTVRGNVEQMTHAVGVNEGFNHGLITTACRNYTISDMLFTGFATDGVYLGAGVPTQVIGGQTLYTADRDAYLRNVTSTGNARNALTVAQLRGGVFVNSTFSESGRTGGAYGGHAPKAGVDVEPKYSPGAVDVPTGDLQFIDSSFLHNVGSQFTSAYRDNTDTVLLANATVAASSDSSLYALVLSVENGVIQDSNIDTQQGAIYANWGTSTSPADTTIRDTQITTSGRGLVATGSNTDITVEGCTFTGVQTTSGTYMPYIQSSTTDFVGNTVFMPKAAFGPNTTKVYRIASLLQGVRLSALNTFQTDLVPGQPALPGGDPTPAGAYFATSYNAALVSHDSYVSGYAYLPWANVPGWTPDQPFSQSP